MNIPSFRNSGMTNADTLHTLTQSNCRKNSHKLKIQKKDGSHKGHSYHLESYWGSGEE